MASVASSLEWHGLSARMRVAAPSRDLGGGGWRRFGSKSARIVTRECVAMPRNFGCPCSSSSKLPPSRFVGDELTLKRHLRSKTLASRSSRDKDNENRPSFPIAKPFESVAEFSDNFLDRVSSYIFRRLRTLFSPYFPKNFDIFSWLPVKIHSRLHSSEYLAIIFVREALIFGFFYVVFIKVDSFCRWLNKLYIRNTKPEQQEVQSEDYEDSSFTAVRGPIKLTVLLWASTRFVNVLTPLKVGHYVIGKVRAIGLVVAVIWFLLRWKRIMVDHLASKSRIDAPRVVAIDKVASLFLYFLAASSIAEVCGFALSSLLAVGGISGLAVGLAAKEIATAGNVPNICYTQAGSFSGEVQDIGFLQTKLLGFDKVPVLVPNQAFINQVIINYSRAKDKLLEATFQVRNQDIFLIEKITNRVVQYLRWHKEVDKGSQPPMCYLKSMGSLGLDIGLLCIIRAPGGPSFFKAQQEILIQVAHIITEEGACLGTSGPFMPVVPEQTPPPEGEQPRPPETKIS
ncbi:hypothetical protein SELMODRAFT_404072 [Selaginella moellendorffii]|uniref:Mechanosensitive ion channel MscS domain-containing protein n=1 Tax=Selaginella moellendorffii TaxID=88036 RepID=D8QU72_SELML|nr:hypothetical protein SELMODRAFT_404072 [Selaginella moellendorffii]